MKPIFHLMIVGTLSAALSSPALANPKHDLARELIDCGNTYNALSLVVTASKQAALREVGSNLLLEAMKYLDGDNAFYDRELGKSAEKVSGDVVGANAEKRAGMAKACSRFLGEGSIEKIRQEKLSAEKNSTKP